MSNYIYSTTRTNPLTFPDRPLVAEVHVSSETRTFRDNRGNAITEPTYDVIAVFGDGSEKTNLENVSFATAKFNADCITGTLGKY